VGPWVLAAAPSQQEDFWAQVVPHQWVDLPARVGRWLEPAVLDCRSTPSGSLAGGNGISTVHGGTIGVGQVPNTDLRKAITASPLSGTGLFSVGQAYALRESVPQGTDPGGFFAVIPVSNISGGPFCLVEVGNVVYRDNSDSALEGPSTLGSAVLGSDGITTWSISSQARGPRPSTSCLASGELGYFVVAAQTAQFTQVTKVEFDICAGGISASEAQTDLHALSYQWTSPGGDVGLGHLDVTVQNQGSADATLGDQSQYIVFDAGSLPVYAGFLYVGQGVVIPHGTSLQVGAQDAGALIGGSGASLLFAVSLSNAP